MYFGLFLTSKVIMLTLGFIYVETRDKFFECAGGHNDTVEETCDHFTGRYLTLIFSIFNVGNIMFSLVVLHTKSVEDYIAKFS